MNFKSLVDSPYYVDKTDYIAILFEETKGSNLITYPRQWGKTTNLEMLKCYVEIRKDETNMFSFHQFEGKKVVSEDFVEASDIAFLYKHIKQDQDIKQDKKINLSIEGTDDVFKYFKNKNYPWFLKYKQSTKIK